MTSYRHAQALAAIVGVLFLFLIAEAVLVSAQLQQLLNDNFEHETTSQLDLMADSSYEAVLKGDYVTIRTFIDRWSMNHPEYLSLRAIAPNGFVILARKRPTPPDAKSIALHKTLSLNGKELLRLELIADSNPSVSAIAASLRNRLFACALLLTAALGFVLWRALQAMAIKPLQQEIARRTQAEMELRRAHDELEATVQERTLDLHQELAERRRVETELVQREGHIRLLLDSTAEGIFGVDGNGLCTFCNPSALSLLGFDNESDMLGTNMYALTNPASPEQESSISQAYRTGQGYHSDKDLFWRKDGTRFSVEYWSFPIKKGDGIPLGTVVTFIDITDRKQLESQLLHVQKMEAIGTLAGGIAHDFNNILSAITGYLDLAMTKVDPDSKLASYLQTILQASCRASDLVKQILTFSRRDPEELSPVEVTLVVKEVINLLKASLPSTIEIKSSIEDTRETVLANPTKIHQIVMNLGTNAYHAMRDTGGVLSVSLASRTISTEECRRKDIGLEPGSYLFLAVSDTGHGMERATLERIFEPYFTTKPTGQGTGMGLAVVHGIVESYGGHIMAHSEIDRGTTFDIYLPVFTPPEAAPESTLSTIAPQTGTERVLLVDDEKIILGLEMELLEYLGYTVRAISRPDDALAEFTLHPDDYDLIITDMTMPQMTGDKLAKAILAIRPDIPIVLCTGLSAEKAKAAGIAEYISKPISLETLAIKVRSALDGRS